MHPSDPGILSRLALQHGTDKWNDHWYTPHYEQHFAQFREEIFTMLEIGIGNDSPTPSGASLRMWRDYFPNALIVGLDIEDCARQNSSRITTVRGSQADPETLAELHERFGPFKIIVDDGSHVNADVLASFDALFTRQTPGSFYCIEDTQTSYWHPRTDNWPGFGGCLPGSASERSTTLGFVKSLVDSINHMEILDPQYRPTPVDLAVVGLHVYHNLVIVERGNPEPSNTLRDNALPPDHALAEHFRRANCAGVFR